jgi:hypothetical protein
MAWHYQCLIAGAVVQVGGDTTACQQDMMKFLCLYEQVEGKDVDLKFHVLDEGQRYAFIFQARDGEVESLWQSDDAREISAALEIHLYSRLVQHLDACGRSSIHAASLKLGSHSVMFAGDSGAGKSSLCTAALLAGAGYFSDEFSLLDMQGMIYPFPRPMQWEHPDHPAFDRQSVIASGLISAEHFDFPDTSGKTVRCHLWHPKHVERKPSLLSHIVLHQYSAAAPSAELIEIPRHEALLELPKHLHVQRGMANDLPKLNQSISTECYFYRLSFSNVFAAWQAVTNVVASD